MESLVRVPEEYRDIYKNHWHTIRESVKHGLIREMYHFPLFDNNQNEISTCVNKVFKIHKKFKINVAFGFILKSRTTGELKFHHPSNNTMVFENPRLVANQTDLTKIKQDIEHEDAIEYARLQRPSTDWVVERIICIRFDVYKLL